MNIAIIGSGISGLVTAYLLSEDHDVTVFEANDYVGGHTRTLDVPSKAGNTAVDTGFIVFNERTYPNFIALLDLLDVPWQPSDMSFSVQCGKTGIEFCPSSFDGIFAQRKNLLNPLFLWMLVDAVRFRHRCRELLRRGDDRETLHGYLRRKRYSKMFREHFILPMGDAIWSADPERFQDFPVRFFAEFFENHGFLHFRQPQWRVVRGGSSRYIEPLTRRFRDRIRVNCPVERIRRLTDGVEISPRGTAAERYDQVVIAAHSDQALALLEDPTEVERDILGNIAYQENDVVLHTDTRLLPDRPSAWASWNYYVPRQPMGRVALTYNMNKLQTLRTPETFCVTLNRRRTIDPASVISRMTYHHPVYCPDSLAARRRREEINGKNNTYYAGAYWGFGFHEDGVNSALAVCRHFGKALPGGPGV
jgi:predicted NAD/FAD-binding protein